MTKKFNQSKNKNQKRSQRQNRTARPSRRNQRERGQGRQGLRNEGMRTDQLHDAKAAKSVDASLEEREDRIEGRNPVREALKSGRQIDKAWIQKSNDGHYEHSLYELICGLRERGTVIVETDKQRLDAMSQTFNHQGIIVQTAMQEYVSIDDILSRAQNAKEPPFIFVLDKIQDAYNLGSIFRIADACGVHGVVIPERRAVGLNAIVAKASVGAIEYVPCAKVTNLTQTILQLKENGIWVAGTDMAGENIYDGIDLNGPLAIVIGNEGEGISPGVLKHCDFTISLPMMGQINSLNASVACGIVAYEALRQRTARK